jgi:hypothetical protein
MTIRLQPVLVETGSNDCEGRLVYCDDRLLGVLVQLSADHGAAAGRWFLEAGFGIHDGNHTFADLQEASDWIEPRKR